MKRCRDLGNWDFLTEIVAGDLKACRNGRISQVLSAVCAVGNGFEL